MYTIIWKGETYVDSYENLCKLIKGFLGPKFIKFH